VFLLLLLLLLLLLRDSYEASLAQLAGEEADIACRFPQLVGAELLVHPGL
jgi:hypothetical protein